MKIIRSDRRHKYYNYGFHFIAEFRMSIVDREKYSSMLKAVEDVHGPYLIWHQHDSWGHQATNDKYKVDHNRKLKRRRIYFKTEQELTFFILKGNVS